MPECSIDLHSKYISAVGSFDVIVEDDLNCLTDGFGSGDVDGDNSMFALNTMKGNTICSHKSHCYRWIRRGFILLYEEKSVKETKNSMYQLFECT